MEESQEVNLVTTLAMLLGEFRPKEWGSASAEPQHRGLHELCLCTSQVQDPYMSFAMSLTPSVMSRKQALFFAVRLIFEPSFINFH